MDVRVRVVDIHPGGWLLEVGRAGKVERECWVCWEKETSVCEMACLTLNQFHAAALMLRCEGKEVSESVSSRSCWMEWMLIIELISLSSQHPHIPTSLHPRETLLHSVWAVSALVTALGTLFGIIWSCQYKLQPLRVQGRWSSWDIVPFRSPLGVVLQI